MAKNKLNKNWLHDHINDPYVKLAQKEGYRARAAYKLKEIDESEKLFKPGQVVGPVQLGSSVFFFEFLGFELDNSGEFDKQKAQWESKLLELKFKERLDDYVRAERTKVKVVRRPMTFKKS